MIKSLFQPATLLMNRLRFSLKFTLIVLLFFVPLLILAFNYTADVNQVLQHSKNELEGLDYIDTIDQQQKSLVKVIIDDLNWRSQVPSEQTQKINAFLEQLSLLIEQPQIKEEEHRERISQQIEKFRENLKSKTEGVGDTRWSPIELVNNLIEPIAQFNNLYPLVANLKGLTNDPAIDTVILSRLIVERRLETLSLLSKSFSLASYAIGESNVSSLTFDSLSVASDQLAANLANVRRLAMAVEDQDAALKSAVNKDIELLVALIDDNLKYLENEFLLADSVTLSKPQLDEYVEQQLNRFYQSKQQLHRLFEQRLINRIDNNTTNFYTLVALVTFTLLLVVYLFIGMSLSISMTTNSLTNIARSLAKGDTRVSATVRTNDELAEAIKAFNTMAVNVHNLVESVQLASKGVSQQTEEVEKIATQTGEAINTQLQDTGKITNAIAELLSAVADVSANTQNVLASLDSATTQTNRGKQTLKGARKATDELGEEIKQSVDVINQLSQQSASINQVLDVIKSIAEQTNLLALNAAIEAARAGEQGRGFAVVADEVRSLAKRTHESTEEIQRTIGTLQQGVKNAVQAMTRSDEKALRSIEESAKLDEALDNISLAVEQIHELNNATENATQQQQQIASQIEVSLASISQISTVTENNVQQSISASQQLAKHVARLETMIDKFKT